MTKIENAVLWALDIAQDDAHGYDQSGRWGPDYDCSALVIAAYEQAGVPVKSAGATYTGNMRGVFKRCGFTEVTDGTLERGDVLLSEAHHTALYIGNGQLVHASINERGGITGGATGDQTGREICVRDYYDRPWDVVLRYAGEGEAADPAPAGESVQGESIPIGTMPTELPILLRGSASGAVLALQLLLIHKWAVSCGRAGADGDYGRDTEAAVSSFQASHGLEADGVCGGATWAALIGGGAK